MSDTSKSSRSVSSSESCPPYITVVADGIQLRVKIVPGASRSRIVAVLGDRLKIQIAAPPESGKANQALCHLLAQTFQIPLHHITITQGQTQPRKTLHISGLSSASACLHLPGI